MSLQARYLYPAAWDGDTEGMTVPGRYALNVTGAYDEDQEDVLIVDISELLAPGRATPHRMLIDELQWSNDGVITALYFDREPERPVITMEGNGNQTWKEFGGLLDDSPSGEATGDLMMTNTIVDADGDFSFTIVFRLKSDD